MSTVRVTTSTLHAALAKGVGHDSLKAKSTRNPAMVRREDPINPDAGRVAVVSRHCGHDRGTGRVGSGIGRVW